MDSELETLVQEVFSTSGEIVTLFSYSAYVKGLNNSGIGTKVQVLINNDVYCEGSIISVLEDLVFVSFISDNFKLLKVGDKVISTGYLMHNSCIDALSKKGLTG